MTPPPGLHDVTVSKVLSAASSDIAHDTGVAETQVVTLREQLSTLELALDHRFLARMTVGALVGAKTDARGPRARREGATAPGEATRRRRRAASAAESALLAAARRR